MSWIDCQIVARRESCFGAFNCNGLAFGRSDVKHFCIAGIARVHDTDIMTLHGNAQRTRSVGLLVHPNCNIDSTHGPTTIVSAFRIAQREIEVATPSCMPI